MNKRLLIAALLSFVAVGAMQFFMGKNKPAPGAGGVAQEVKAGQFYAAQAQQYWPDELNREVDFVKVKDFKTDVLSVETDLYKATFSNVGGLLESLSFKKYKDRDGQFLQTIYKQGAKTLENGCFLLAFEGESPLEYKLVEHKEDDNFITIGYQTEYNQWVVKKTYLLNKASHQMDLVLDFEPKAKDVTELIPRIFFPSPELEEFKSDDVSCFVNKGIKSIEKISANKELSGVWGMPEIFGIQSKYFAHSLVKDNEHFVCGGYLKKVNNKLFSILLGNSIKKKDSYKLSFYMGPKQIDSLEKVDERLEGLLSFGWFSWLSRLFLKWLASMYKYFGNYGIAIIVLTILLKIPFMPLTIIAGRKMEEYQKYQPTLGRIRQKFRQDPARQQAEIVKFHKDHNISPATSMIGCLPVLIQIPILISLYRGLGNYLDLYQAPFFGWITDLSVKDPYYVLPILMGVAMLWGQKLKPPAGDPKMKVVGMFMPIVVTAVFINFPAGLALYWCVNNILTVGEDLLRKKIFK